MKVLVYTAIFGDKDEAPMLVGKYNITDYQVDFLCITDNTKLTSPDYQIEFAKPVFSDITKNARYYKIIGPKNALNYDIVIWHDSSVMLDREKLTELIAYGETNAFSTFKHGNTSIYAEARDCIRHNKDTPLKITFQMALYAFWFHFPVRSLLFETTILVYNTQKYFTTSTSKSWWRHLKYLSRRDQLSLPVVLRKSSINPIGCLVGKGFDNPYSVYRGHRYYHYNTTSILPQVDNRIAKKAGLWIIYNLELLQYKKDVAKNQSRL